MTTVDVRIERVGSGDRLFLHNGMWGPATSVLRAFGRAYPRPQQSRAVNGPQHDPG